MENLFTELYGLDSTDSIKKQWERECRVVPDLDEKIFEGAPSSKYGAAANKIMATEFTDSVLGHTISDPVGTSDAELEKLEKFCKDSGLVGQKLLRLTKAYSSLPEAMSKMVENFKEFFSVEDKEILDRAIKALDLHAFFQIVNARVYAS